MRAETGVTSPSRIGEHRPSSPSADREIYAQGDQPRDDPKRRREALDDRVLGDHQGDDGRKATGEEESTDDERNVRGKLRTDPITRVQVDPEADHDGPDGDRRREQD